MIFCIFGGGKCRPRWGVQRGLPLALLGNFQRYDSIAARTNSLISYGIFSANTLRRAVRLPFCGGCPCRLLTHITPPYFSPFGRWVAGRSFSFSKALLHGAVGYKVFPINTLAAKREEDLSGNGAAARPFSRHKAPCLLCLCKRK